ncbi:subclass B1 metallo-beta-lactamase [Arcticibacter sp.]|uniref:subclass B1 metallo-beta-lactamase n=1 Tax=Arcticibacter sp. TaxID=1872630 RepID=UPI0038911599
MKTFILLILSAFACSCALKKDPQSSRSYKSGELEVKPIAEDVYQHISYLKTESFGRVSCNGMIVANHNEAIIIDTPTDEKTSAELISWVENSLRCKVKAVVATHFHDDCLGGLNAFHTRGIPSVANERTIALAKEKNLPVPQSGFADKKTLRVGTQQVLLDYSGEGHTRDNIIAYFPHEGIMFGGCLIKEQGAGKGNLADANIAAWAETIISLKARYPNTRMVIPGHGKIGGPELFDYTADLFKKP